MNDKFEQIHPCDSYLPLKEPRLPLKEPHLPLNESCRFVRLVYGGCARNQVNTVTISLLSWVTWHCNTLQHAATRLSLLSWVTWHLLSLQITPRKHGICTWPWRGDLFFKGKFGFSQWAKTNSLCLIHTHQFVTNEHYFVTHVQEFATPIQGVTHIHWFVTHVYMRVTN